MSITLATATTLVTAARRLDRLRYELGCWEEECAAFGRKGTSVEGRGTSAITQRDLDKREAAIEKVVAQVAKLETALVAAEEMFK